MLFEIDSCNQFMLTPLANDLLEVMTNLITELVPQDPFLYVLSIYFSICDEIALDRNMYPTDRFSRIPKS